MPPSPALAAQRGTLDGDGGRWPHRESARMGGRWHSHQEMEFTIFTRGEDTRYVCDSVVLELAKPGVPAKFIAYEMPADFVQDLKDDIAAIRAADSEMDSDDQEDVASTAAVGRLIKSGMAEVTQLDAIMNNK